MVKVNGKEFKIYDLDTQTSIISRIAASNKTLPKYIYFPEGKPTLEQFKNSDNIIVEDLLKIIKDDDNSFYNIYQEVKTKNENLGMIDVLYPHIFLIEKYSGELGEFSLLELSNVVENNNLYTNVDISNLEKDIPRLRKEFNENIKNIKTSSEEQEKRFKEFDKVKPSIISTKFESQKIDFEFDISLKHITIMELFNHIKLNPEVPFACIGNIYKILKDFVPDEKWSVSFPSIILLKIFQKKSTSAVFGRNNYTDAIISISGDPGQEKVSIGISLNTESTQYLSQEELIERTLGCITGLGDITISGLKENKITGVFYIPKHTFNKYVFSDLAMNDPIFYSLLAIDESDKASKKKKSIYIHFYSGSVGELTANITEKISEKGDAALRGKDIKNLFAFGTRFIRIKLTTKSIDSVNKFQTIFLKLLSLYDSSYDRIVNIYREYIPNFAKKQALSEKQKEEHKLKLRDIAPEVFVTGYPPKCPKQPTVIEDDEVEQAKAEGKQVMTYPVNDTPEFPRRNYICDHTKSKFPGLRDNPLANIDLVPYLPCCYEKDHSKKEGSIYRHYFLDEPLKVKDEENQQDLITTHKFVSRDKFGTLPDIIDLFNIFDDETGYLYVRKGVSDTNSSFLECVMEGMYETSKILENATDVKRNKFLLETRQKLATDKYAAACKQEMYDYPIDEIKKIISDTNVYFDPKFFVSLLEIYFGCNIYIFSKSKSGGTRLVLPRHTQTFYKMKRGGNSILIYEHFGSTSNNVTIPRCELIVKWKIGDPENVKYFYEENSEIAIGIKNVYEQVRRSYVYNKPIQEIEFPVSTSIFTGQVIDSYGKSRMLNFSVNKIEGTLVTYPIQPLPVQIMDVCDIKKISIEDALTIIAILNIIPTSQKIINNKVKEIGGVLGNVNVFIPINSDKPVETIPTSENPIEYIECSISAINSYNYYIKIARYVVEYTFWLFSKFVQENLTDRENMDNSVIGEFVKKNVKVDMTFNYPKVSKTFSMDSKLIRNNKLIVKSEETLKRLIYLLRVNIVRQRSKILNYHIRKTIENYYVDVTDFDQYPLEVILQGSNSVEKWISEQKNKYELVNVVEPNRIIPYYFQNNLISNSIFLAQNTDSIKRGLAISRAWKRSGYNPGNKVDEYEKKVEFTLYSYQNSTSITGYKIEGSKADFDAKIIGYRLEEEGKAYFTVLLEL